MLSCFRSWKTAFQISFFKLPKLGSRKVGSLQPQEQPLLFPGLHSHEGSLQFLGSCATSSSCGMAMTLSKKEVFQELH